MRKWYLLHTDKGLQTRALSSYARVNNNSTCNIQGRSHGVVKLSVNTIRNCS